MEIAVASRSTPSDAARQRMASVRSEPMFYARWDRAVFIHYTADPAILQPDVPFELDLRDGHAFVSIVAFTLARMRPRLGGLIGEWFLKPIATHQFLNVRTYVRHAGEPGIFFLAEWLNNRKSVLLGPRSFGLPYRFGEIAVHHARNDDALSGTVQGRDGQLAYAGKIGSDEFGPCEAGSLNE